jgi:hypothetical protein
MSQYSSNESVSDKYSHIDQYSIDSDNQITSHSSNGLKTPSDYTISNRENSTNLTHSNHVESTHEYSSDHESESHYHDSNDSYYTVPNIIHFMWLDKNNENCIKYPTKFDRYIASWKQHNPKAEIKI